MVNRETPSASLPQGTFIGRMSGLSLLAPETVGKGGGTAYTFTQDLMRLRAIDLVLVNPTLVKVIFLFFVFNVRWPLCCKDTGDASSWRGTRANGNKMGLETVAGFACVAPPQEGIERGTPKFTKPTPKAKL